MGPVFLQSEHVEICRKIPACRDIIVLRSIFSQQYKYHISSNLYGRQVA